MPTQYTPGQILQRGDLSIFFQDGGQLPTNVYEITYNLYYVDPVGPPPGLEVLIPPSPRTPVNPVYGEYYAAVMVPPGATLGAYRVRWLFREAAGQPIQEVVQEFEVTTPSVIADPFSAVEKDCIRALRILLRDNCVAGEQLVEVDAEGEKIFVSMQEIYDMIGDESKQQNKIKESFSKKNLKIRSVSPEGDVEWKAILYAHRHEVPWETIWDITTSKGTMTLTGGHKVFTSPTEKIEAEKIIPGDFLLGVEKEEVQLEEVISVTQKEARQYMYDLTAEDHHNFVLSGCNITISNSPDRNYHFRPPEHEGVIGNFNRVFGFIWEDYELLEYLKWALDWWNMQPPETEHLCTLQALMQSKPAWKVPIMWGAMVYALFALSVNWVSEEFSVGGEEVVKVYLPSGECLDVSLEDLYEICKG